MRRLLALIGFMVMVIASVEVSAQDLIVTISGDSMNVQIQKDTEQFLYYRTDKSRKGDYVISRKEVSSLVYGFYTNQNPLNGDAANAGGAKRVINTNNEREALDKFQIWGAYGFAYMIAEPEDGDLKEYTNDLKTGFNFSVGASYFLNERFGFGAYYEQSNFDAKFDGWVRIQTPTGAEDGQLADDITIQHFGGEVLFRFPLSRTGSAFQLSAGMGYATYHDDGTIVYDYVIEGGALALGIGASFQVALGGGIYIPLKFALKSVTFNDIEVEGAANAPDWFKHDFLNQIEQADEGLAGSRIELSIGLLWMF